MNALKKKIHFAKCFRQKKLDAKIFTTHISGCFPNFNSIISKNVLTLRDVKSLLCSWHVISLQIQENVCIEMVGTIYRRTTVSAKMTVNLNA